MTAFETMTAARAELPKFYAALGHDGRGAYYFRNAATQEIVQLSPRSMRHLKLVLISLAPLQYWEAAYPTDARWRPRTDWLTAYDALLRQAEKAGSYPREASQ